MPIQQDLAMKFTNTPLTDLTYSLEDTTITLFRTKKLLELINTEVVSITLLNGRKVEHMKFTNGNLSIILGTDNFRTDMPFLDNSRMNWLRAWWESKHKYIAKIPFNPMPTYTGEVNHFLMSDLNIDFDNESYRFDFFEVVTGGGLFPLSFVNDLDLLPEFTMNLQRVLPI